MLLKLKLKLTDITAVICSIRQIRWLRHGYRSRPDQLLVAAVLKVLQVENADRLQDRLHTVLEE